MQKKNSSFKIISKNLVVLFLVILWVIPTVGLLISSLRDKELLTSSGWWTAFFYNQKNEILRTATDDEQIQEGDFFIIRGNLLEPNSDIQILKFSLNIDSPGEFEAGEEIVTDKFMLKVEENGDYYWKSKEKIVSSRGMRIYALVDIPPSFTLANYFEVFQKAGLSHSFLNSFTVTIPATFIPILIAAFAAYTLAWIDFRGRKLILFTIIGLLVVPLQMSLIPVLSVYNIIGDFFGVPAKSYLGIWLAHTGFGLPLAIYLLYNYISALPRELIESAKIDGADHFKIFVKIIIPLSIPALASFAIFQFLWVWNDLLVALVFLGKGDNQIVLTSQLRELLGSRGGNWEILTASAFVTIIVPVLVFISLQRYFVRGLLSGSVK